MGVRAIAALGCLGGLIAAGCASSRHAGSGGPREELTFEPILITGDPELEKLNDEELFAAGSSAFAAQDYRQAERYFDRLTDYYPNSPHRRAALYNSGFAYEKQLKWEEAAARFASLADPARGTGDSLDAAFRLAETQYHLERYPTAIQILTAIADRPELALGQRIEALAQKGICELEAGQPESAEATLRRVLNIHQSEGEEGQADEYFPAQAQFFLGEIYRLRYEGVNLDPEKGIDTLSQDLEYKAQLLLSAQGHYLRAIRMGNPHWSTASGAQIGMLYENLYTQMVNSPAPKELTGEEADVYRQELRKKIRILVTKAINIYERTLEAAERMGTASVFVARTKDSLQKLKEILVADAPHENEEKAAGR
jgi:tetratricopeptide (TPR) repeat protein